MVFAVMNYLTPKEFAEHESVKVTPQTVRNWVAEGRIEHRRRGRKILIPETELEKHVEARRPQDISLGEFSKKSGMSSPDIYEAIALGRIRLDFREGRALVPVSELERVKSSASLPSVSLGRVPILGQVSAGPPILEEENTDGWAETPMDSGARYAVRANGDSMAPKIEHGDVVFIQPTGPGFGRTARLGKVVIAVVDGEVTLKWLRKNADGSRSLVPENPRYREILVREGVEIIGQVVGRYGAM